MVKGRQGGALIAFRIRDFRLYWSGLAAQVAGQHMFQFTLGWLAFEITGSQGKLAVIQLSAFLPQVTLTLVGGALADRVDPRRLIQTAQSIAATGVLLVLAATLSGRVQLWHLAAGAFLLGLSNAIDEPSRAAFFPRLLPQTHLRSGVPLISMAFGGSRIVAPSIAGFAIAAAGAPASFVLSTLGISSMIAILCLVRPGTRAAPSHGSLLDNFTESVRYIRQNEVFSRVIAAALLNAAFIMGYQHVLPVFAKDVLGVDSRGLGLMVTAIGTGALTGLLSYPWLGLRATPRNIMVYALSGYCCALIGVAISSWFWVSCLLLVAVGISQAYFMTSCQVILQTLVDDHYRGRVMGVFTLVWSLVYLSGFLLNFAGAWAGPQAALAGAAGIVLIYVWVSLVRSPALAALRISPRSA